MHCYFIILAPGGDEVLVRSAEAGVDGEMTLAQAAEPTDQRTRTYTHKHTHINKRSLYLHTQSVTKCRDYSYIVHYRTSCDCRV